MAYTVGELAKRSGLTVRALHHCEKLGLLPPSGRTQAGYRLYAERDVRVHRILAYRQMGVVLKEIAPLLSADAPPLLDVLTRQLAAPTKKTCSAKPASRPRCWPRSPRRRGRAGRHGLGLLAADLATEDLGDRRAGGPGLHAHRPHQRHVAGHRIAGAAGRAGRLCSGRLAACSFRRGGMSRAARCLCPRPPTGCGRRTPWSNPARGG